MKNYFLFFLGLILISCQSDGNLDCLRKQGDLVSKQIEIAGFDKIRTSLGIELIISQADEYSVKVEFGKNMIDDIQFKVEEGTLKITNTSSCQMLRNYHSAKVFVSTPVLTKIHSGSQYPVRSAGVLRFPELMLESGIIEEDLPPGNFEVEVDNEKLKINDNVSSIYKVRGKTQNLEVDFWATSSRFEGAELICNELNFYHRSSNDIIVHPIQKVSGTLAGTGNLVLKNLPETIEVEQIYTGHIVYPN